MSLETGTRVDVEDTIIRIELPLPLDVVASITTAFGHLWPNGAIDTRRSGSGHLTMRIPHDDRCKTKRAATKIRADKTYLESEIEASVRGFGDDGTFRADAPAYIAHTIGAAARAMFEDNPAAVNYMEMQVHDPETGNRYVITAAKSAEQTPAALRLAAEARAEAADAKVQKVWELLEDPYADLNLETWSTLRKILGGDDV